jgi:hypothetical protein
MPLEWAHEYKRWLRAQASDKCWHMSIWETDPVMALYVCNDYQECSENDESWIALEKLWEFGWITLFPLDHT